MISYCPSVSTESPSCCSVRAMNAISSQQVPSGHASRTTPSIPAGIFRPSKRLEAITVDDSSGTFYASGATFTISASTTLYAVWTPASEPVTYDGNSETSGTVPVDSSSPYPSGATVTVLVIPPEQGKDLDNIALTAIPIAHEVLRPHIQPHLLAPALRELGPDPDRAKALTHS
jgi:hypothetical protein